MKKETDKDSDYVELKQGLMPESSRDTKPGVLHQSNFASNAAFSSDASFSSGGGGGISIFRLVAWGVLGSLLDD